MQCMSLNLRRCWRWARGWRALQGDVPWLAVRSALESVGYQGYITAEVSGYRLFPELGLRHIADALRAVFQS